MVNSTIKNREELLLEIEELKQKLNSNEERFWILYDSTPDMFVSVSATDASILQCNQTLFDKTGYLREEIIDSPIFIVYHNDSLPDAHQAFKEFKTTGKLRNKELIQSLSFMETNLIIPVMN